MADPACSSPYRFLLHQEEPSLFFSKQGPGQPLPIHSLETDLFCARPRSRCCSKLCRPRHTRRRKAGASKPISYTRMLSGLTCPRSPRGQPGLREAPAHTRSASRPTPAGPRCRLRSPTMCLPASTLGLVSMMYIVNSFLRDTLLSLGVGFCNCAV